MPPTTYSGTVRNDALGTPEPNARIIATRPGLNLNFQNFWFTPEGAADVEIGEARSATDGRFVLITSGGYATQLAAVSRDGWLDGWLEKDLKYGRKDLLIGMRPHLQEFSFSAALSDAEVTMLESAFNKIVFHYASTRYRDPLSIDGYRKRGIISEEEFALLVKERAYVCGPKPRIEAVYAPATLRIDSFTTPVRFVPHSPNLLPIDMAYPPSKKHS